MGWAHFSLDRRGPLHPAWLTSLRSLFAARSVPFARASAPGHSRIGRLREGAPTDRAVAGASNRLETASKVCRNSPSGQPNTKASEPSPTRRFRARKRDRPVPYRRRRPAPGFRTDRHGCQGKVPCGGCDCKRLRRWNALGGVIEGSAGRFSPGYSVRDPFLYGASPPTRSVARRHIFGPHTNTTARIRG